MLHIVVLDYQELLLSRGHKGLNAIEGALQILSRRGLYQIGKGSVVDAVLLFLLNGNDLHRDVARLGRELEVAKHCPAKHVGQKNIQRDNRRPIVTR